MSFNKQYCFLPECDGCGPDWAVGDPTATETPHFASETEGRKILVEDYGWRITDRPDGTLQMLCVSCVNGVAGAGCDELGCDWQAAEIDPLGDSPPRVAPIELCRRCSRVRREDVPPALHPESITAELSAADEALLKALDAELFPKETR